MTKSQLVTALYEQNYELGLHKRDLEAVVDVIFDSISQELACGGRVEIRGLGSFSVRVSEPREGRNPRSGEAVQIPGRAHVYFRCGKDLLHRINRTE